VGYFFCPVNFVEKDPGLYYITTFSVSFCIRLVALTANQTMIFIFSTAAGIFQAGIDLVFFDELMKTIPPRYSPTFVSLAQSVQYFSAILAPLVGTYLAQHIGLTNALIFSTCIRLLGFVLFARQDHHSTKSTL
jgi:predicted MFS family arabinose efflux permease